MSKAKAVTANIKLMIKAGQAKPGPPIGPALGQAGLNIMNFCKDFNAKTSHIKDDVPIPVKLTAYSDKTFTYVTKTPPASYFITKAAGITKGSQKPGHSVAAEISAKVLYEIALVKQRESPHGQYACSA
ncbi:hypothetical protein WJX73_002790 [Symbiochloris irregularis]|uniref:Large ribosomal subunit protein uL11m n=1 Tax=Symbiochloris irregularis TaxID=706552 RepID=A0AAW1PYP2_9CHLO